MQEKTFTVNPIPQKAYTWSWLKINNDSVKISFDIAKKIPSIKNAADGITITSGKKIITSLPEPEAASGGIWEELFKEDDSVITIEGNHKAPIIIDYELQDNENASSVIAVHLKENANASIIFFYHSKPQSNGFFAVRTRVYAEKNAEARISKVQSLGNGFFQIDETSLVCAERSKTSFTQVELGGNHIDSGLHTQLHGDSSEFFAQTAYIVQGSQYLDMNHVVCHKGKKTVSVMKADGTMMDSATKIYRGTIDLQRGSLGSDGNETEGCLMLSPNVINKSAPIILCDEDDVHGEHGATIGKLASDMLFYMQTRGIDEKTARMLLAKGKIQAVASEIQDDVIQSKIQEHIERIFTDEK